MNVTRALAIVLIAMSFGGGSASAQNISSVQAPAEFPPASFKGRQYVDSNGCVFVRAGIDGNVTWVPRVSRDRKVICGFQPSLPGNAGQAVVAAQPTQEPVQITVAPEPETQPAPAAKPAPKPEPVATVAMAKPKPVQVQPAPKTVVISQPKAVVQTKTVTMPKLFQVRPKQTAQPTVVRIKPSSQPAPKPTVKTVTIATTNPAPAAKTMAPRQSACRGASAISSKYLNTSRGVTVRCGPQASSHVTYGSGGDTRKLARVETVPTATYTTVYVQPVPLKRAAATPTAQSRFVPAHVYNDQQNATRGVYIPKGYKSTWEDDRLNPRRAHQTFEGKAQMELRWTNTVPRRLVDARTGKEVRYLFPELQYPNTSYETQVIAGVSASTEKAPGKRPHTNLSTRAAQEGMSTQKSTVTTRSTVQKQPAARAQKKVNANNRKPVIAGVSSSVATRSSTVKSKASSVAQPKATTKVRATTTHRYVQVGLYGEPVNAQRAAQRLANAGLPARMGNSGRYKVVVAGPFASQDQLTAALRKVRSMGFSDAYLRK